MGWLIALAVLVALAYLPLGVTARYDSGGPLLKLILGPVRLTLYPSKKRRKETKKTKTEKKSTKGKGSSTGKSKGGNYSYFLPLVQTVLDFLEAFRWKLRVNRLELKLILGGDDPCDLAVNYGRAWASLGNLMPVLEQQFVIKKRELEVECDFLSDKTLIIARVDLTVTLGRIFSLGAVHGVRILRQYLKIAKMRKGGAKL